MRLGIASPLQEYKEKIISDIGFARSSNNIADGLTKKDEPSRIA